MAKKKKDRRSLAQKHQQLQQVSRLPLAAQPISLVSTHPAVATTEVEQPLPKVTVPGITRTLVSVMIIVVLFVVVVVVSHRSSLLVNFGSWLYGALRLSQN